MRARLERAVRWTAWRVLGAWGVARLVVAVALGRVHQLWIGDSHAILLNTPRFPFRMAPVGDGRFVWHLGPRLLHSVAVHGFPSPVAGVARVLGRLPGARRLVCVFVFGEIDVRCHLAPRLAPGAAGLDPGFVDDYVGHCRLLADTIGAGTAVLVVPTPPGDDIEDHVMFPIAGDLTERIAAHAWVRDALARAVHTGGTSAAGSADLTLLDLGEVLGRADGRLRSDLTDDGCHTNDAGRALVRARLLDLLATEP